MEIELFLSISHRFQLFSLSILIIILLFAGGKDLSRDLQGRADLFPVKYYHFFGGVRLQKN